MRDSSALKIHFIIFQNVDRILSAWFGASPNESALFLVEATEVTSKSSSRCVGFPLLDFFFAEVFVLNSLLTEKKKFTKECQVVFLQKKVVILDIFDVANGDVRFSQLKPSIRIRRKIRISVS